MPNVTQLLINNGVVGNTFLSPLFRNAIKTLVAIVYFIFYAQNANFSLYFPLTSLAINF